MRSLIDFLLPRSCLSCSVPLRGELYALPLCGPCQSRLVPLEGPRCHGCGRELPEPLKLCAVCRSSPPAFDRLLATWSFEPPLADVLRALKFQRLEGLGKPLAETMAPTIAAHLEEGAFEVDLVVPVPLHFLRRLRRGYNQAERLARPLAGMLGKPFGEPLRRRRSTLPQARLSRSQRRKNLQDAFRLGWAAEVAGRRILLIDDVVTTGATLRGAAAALRQAGSGPVLAAALARTPEVPRDRQREAGIMAREGRFDAIGAEHYTR